jgi:lysyl-tRNA synthetase class 2
MMAGTDYLDDRFYLARKSHALHLRAFFLQSLRRYFAARDFLEVETPVRLPSPAPEEHIEALPTGDWFLQTSPELGMKRLLAAGYPRIFQICQCFRAGERGARHLPEFTLLEWYVAGFDYRDLMNQCEELLICVLAEAGQDRQLSWQDKKIHLAAPWERLTVADAFDRYAPVTLEEALANHQFDEILVEHVEPRLGCERPTFLYDYPAPLAALARVKKSDPSVAERFELYLAGLEIANGYSELTDAAEQRRRFEEALRARARKNWARYSMPEKFLDALAVMPDAAGIALGVDRMVMLLAGASTIDDVVAFPPETL